MTLDVRGYARAVGMSAGPRLNHGDRSVLAWLTLFVNALTGETWVSATTLATVVGLTERNTRQHLTNLVAAGYVIAERRPGRSTLYRLPCAVVEDPAESYPHPGRQRPGEQTFAPVASDRYPGRQRPDTPVASDLRNSQGTVRETLPTIHVANGFAAAADDTGEFELAPEIYARIGHHMPKARPKGSA